MIDEDRTEQLFGFKSTDLKPKSNKKIVVVCEECGSYRVIAKCDHTANKYSHLCKSCALIENRKNPLVREKISKGVKQAHKDDPTLAQRKARKGKDNGNYKGKVEIPCSYCGNTLSLYQTEIDFSDNHFCDRLCYGKWRSENIIGENHPRTIDHIEIECDNCGKKILRTKNNLDKYNQHFCDDICHNEWQIGRNVGEENPDWINRIEVVCSNCGNIILKRPSEIRDNEIYFCDRKCVIKWFTGEKSPGWKGGLSFGKYCPKFNNTFKQQVRDDYNNRCFICGKTEEENGQKQDVHHVNYDKDCLCGAPCEFVPLCKSHHAMTNSNRKYWEDLIMCYLYPERYFIVDI